MSDENKKSYLHLMASDIKNKQKRSEIYQKQKSEKVRLKKKLREKRKREAEEAGDNAAPKKVARTIDNCREFDETVVEPEDEEVKADELMDEFANYFSGGKHPKIVITTSYKPTKLMYTFIQDLLNTFPNSFYYARKKHHLKSIIKECSAKGFTDLIVINEDRKKLNGLTLVHLPEGPTAYFRLTSVKNSKEIVGHGNPTSHKPEVILNNFGTRLGHRVGRMLASLVHQEPNFKGRRVITFHNQRDYIFFRHHRYIFDNAKKARIQELGPRFTLKLKWLQAGTFDTKHGQYEWKHKTEMDTSRRRFFL